MSVLVSPGFCEASDVRGGICEVVYEACDFRVNIPSEYVFEMGSCEYVRMLLVVCEGRDSALVYRGEVGEEHV